MQSTEGRKSKAIKLTKDVVRARRYPRHRTKGGPHYVWDSVLSGFALKIRPTGHKSYCYRYTSPVLGKKRELLCGDAAAITVQDAREQARQADRLVRGEGKDPQEQRQAERDAPTVAVFAERYLRQHVAKKSASTQRNVAQQLRRYILPQLGSRKLGDVSRADVTRLAQSIGGTKKSGGQGKPIQANRTVALLSKMLNTADQWGLHLGEGWRNPCRGHEPYAETRRQRYLGSEELQRLGEALAGEEARDSSAVDAIRLLLFTGCRLNEVLKLRRQDVDMERAVLRLPRSKTGYREVQLSAPAKEVLARQPGEDASASEWLFPGSNPAKARCDLNGPWRRIRKAAALEDLRLHDLRHTFASVAAGSGFGLHLIGGLLGHTQPATTQRYAHLSASPLQHANERIGAEVAARLEGRKPADVIPFDSASARRLVERL